MLINVNDINLNYEVYGYGKPIILLHGNGETHNIFDKLIYKLEKEYTVYAVDSRCHGKSEYTKLISYDLMAEDVIEFIKKLNIKTPILYGFSDGGIIGLLIAIKEPQLLSNLIISGANITPDATTWLDNFFTKIAYFFTRNKLIKMMLDEPNITFEELHKIAIPVHILAGEKDVIKLEHTKLIAENIKNSTLKIILKETIQSIKNKTHNTPVTIFKAKSGIRLIIFSKNGLNTNSTKTPPIPKGTKVSKQILPLILNLLLL